MIGPNLLVVLSVLGMLFQAAPAPAVQVPPRPESSRDELGTLLPPAYADPQGALRLLAPLRELHPTAVDLHLATAREATALGLLGGTADERMGWLEHAERAARQAVALDPARANSHFWLAASLGLKADQSGGRSKITLAREAYAAALRALEIDSLHGGAHHIVGRLHNGAKRLSRVSRVIARGLGLGGILDEASWESAEHHLRLGAELAPEPLVHHIELAKLLINRGQGTEGETRLKALAMREPRYALDTLYIREARTILSRLNR